jgi:hypothetical protein
MTADHRQALIVGTLIQYRPLRYTDRSPKTG